MGGNRNSEGYMDPTAHAAISAIIREEKKQRKATEKEKQKKQQVKDKGGTSHA